MKLFKKITVTLVFLITISITAQQGINYKALIKDGGGNVVANQNITVQFIIYKGAALTKNKYQETHTPTTDANGIIIVNISEGTPVSGDYVAIKWDSDDHFLNVQIDAGGGLTDMGTTQFMAVPYALHAKTATTALNAGAASINDLTDGKTSTTAVYLGEGAGFTETLTNRWNVGVGYNALNKNTTGDFNTATGLQALLNNLSGNHNTATGFRALNQNTEGHRNTASGSRALNGNIIGNENTAYGFEALYSNTGSNNTAIGHGALSTNTTGAFNTAIGHGALSTLTSGINNIAIGDDAQVPNAEGSHQIRIGDIFIQSAVTQVAWTTPSDRRWKENIRELPYVLKFVKQLKPVDYIRKNNDARTRDIGFIAQDVEALLTKVGYTDQGFLTKDDKGFLSVRYNDFIALLTKAIQEQQEFIEKQESQIKILTANAVDKDVAYKALDKRVKHIEQLINTSQQ